MRWLTRLHTCFWPVSVPGHRHKSELPSTSNSMHRLAHKAKVATKHPWLCHAVESCCRLKCRSTDYTPWTKKRTIIEIRGEKNAVPRVIHQEYIRTRVGNSILWGLPRQNSKFVIDDAQPLSFQVVMHSTLNTCMLALSRSSIFLTGISG